MAQKGSTREFYLDLIIYRVLHQGHFILHLTSYDKDERVIVWVFIMAWGLEDSKLLSSLDHAWNSSLCSMWSFHQKQLLTSAPRPDKARSVDVNPCRVLWFAALSHSPPLSKLGSWFSLTHRLQFRKYICIYIGNEDHLWDLRKLVGFVYIMNNQAWEVHKLEIKRLYLKENKTLQQVIRFMKTVRGFCAPYANSHALSIFFI